MKSTEEDIKGSEFDELVEERRLWASYRGQTLTRTGYFSFTPPPPKKIKKYAHMISSANC